MVREYRLKSHIMGYHVYQASWRPTYNEKLQTRREPENFKDPLAVCVVKNGEIVGHLRKGGNGRFARTISYFLRADADNQCRVVVTGVPVNDNDGMGMKVPCELIFNGQRPFIAILRRELSKMKI